MKIKYFSFILIFVLFANGINALEDNLCVTAQITDISPTSIHIGEEFTVGILLDNCGNSVPDEVIFELTKVSPLIGVKDPLKTEVNNFGYSNSDRFILYHMKVDDDALPGVYEFNYKLSYGSGDFFVIEDGSFSIIVIGDRAELAIASIKSNPVLPEEGDVVELTLRIENAGDGTAKSVRLYADHPFDGVKQSFLGALESDEDGPAVLTFIVEKEGEYTFPVILSYTDDFGDKEIVTEVSLRVLEKPSNIGSVLIVILLLGVIGGMIYYFVKTKKAKDKVIQQLLRGHHKK